MSASKPACATLRMRALLYTAMIKNPYISALLASSYIVLLVSGVYFTSKYESEVRFEIVLPMIVLSILVLSVATMAYLFFFRPLVLLFENKAKESARHFLTALFSFAGITTALGLVFLLLQVTSF